jgi:hypothetical protein
MEVMGKVVLEVEAVAVRCHINLLCDRVNTLQVALVRIVLRVSQHILEAMEVLLISN